MSTVTGSEAQRALQETIDRLIQGKRDPEETRKACEAMDAAREEIRQRLGTVEIAVELIREARQ